MPRIFALFDDPERLVPLVFVPEDFMIVVTGDPLRTNAYMFGHNGTLGYPVARKINLPPDWSERLVDISNSGH